MVVPALVLLVVTLVGSQSPCSAIVSNLHDLSMDHGRYHPYIAFFS
jgi:hypothetical protein